MAAAVKLLDSTPISLLNSAYDWAEPYRTRKGRGLKVHLLLDAYTRAPEHVGITSMNVNDITHAQQGINVEPGATYVFDKGYNDYNWWYDINSSNALFVTRLKRNSAYRIIDTKLINPEANEGEVLAEHYIKFTSRHAGGGRRANRYTDQLLRVVEVERAFNDKPEPFQFVTNDMGRSAEEIANLYKQRWDIELFFKWIKQRLKIKHFWGKSENAVRLQIYVAIIAYLLVVLTRTSQNLNRSLSQVLIELKHTLLVRESTSRHYYQRRRERELYIQSRQRDLPL